MTGDASNVALGALSPSRRMHEKFLREVASAGLARGPVSSDVLSGEELAYLPEVVRKFLRFAGVVDRPRTWSFRAHARGGFRMGPDKPWMPCEAWQYNSAVDVARIFHMRVNLGRVVPVYVRDVYAFGRARMVGKIFDTFRIVDDCSDEVRTGELVTYLNDAILFAPSMLVGGATVWSGVDERSFDVSLTDRGLAVAARVFVDARGAVTNFSTNDRFGTDPKHPGKLVRARWTTPVSSVTAAKGRLVPARARAIWHFPGVEYAYADFHFSADEIEYDVSPESAVGR